MVLQCLFSGMILLALGVIGDYVARSYEESQGRPLYVLTSAINTAAPREIDRASILLRRDIRDLNGFELNGFEDQDGVRERQAVGVSSGAPQMVSPGPSGLRVVTAAPASSGSSILLIEAGLTLLMVLIAVGWPRAGSGIFGKIERALGELARRRALSVAVVGVTAGLLRLLILPFYPIPQPFLYGDFSYLLASDTYASGRLTRIRRPRCGPTSRASISPSSQATLRCIFPPKVYFWRPVRCWRAIRGSACGPARP